jgi:hypothetical protein
MAQNLSTYSPDEVVVIISQPSSGVSTRVTGYMEDSFVSVTPDVETWTHVTGADNHATRVYNANRSGKITLSLLQSTNSNDILTQLWERDAALKNSQGLFTILVADKSGRSVHSSLEAYIGKRPDAVYGNGVNGREWVINCTNLVHSIAGNSTVSPEIVEILNKLGTDIADEWKA